jgi:ribosome maturation factor RimP
MVILEKIEELISKDIQKMGFILWGVEVFGRGKYRTLRIFIDSVENITLEDCTNVSRHVSVLLDTEDLLDSHYNLEVSSPGIDRKFFKRDQYSLFIGSKLRIRFKEETNGYSTIEGILEGSDSQGIIVDIKGIETRINFDSIEKANLQEIF